MAVIVAVILAAGASTRFGAPKQALLLEPVLERVRRAGSVDEILVVLGAHEVPTSATSVRCSDWERGPGASLRCGLAELGDEVEAAVVVLADGPDLTPAAIDRVVTASQHSQAPVTAASYAGMRGHPVVLRREIWPQIPDEGARLLEAKLVPCGDLGAPGDVDFADDLPRRLSRRLGE